MAPHSITLARGIPWAEEPGGVEFIWLQRDRHDLVTKLSPPMAVYQFKTRASLHNVKVSNEAASADPVAG